MKSFKLSVFFFCCGMAALSISCSPNTSWSVQSPSGNLQAEVSLVSNGRLVYSVMLADSSGQEPLIGLSPMGLIRSDGDFSSEMKFIGATPAVAVVDSFVLTVGKQLKNVNRANEITLTFANGQGKEMQVVFRVYDNGVAFRYAFPGPGEGLYTVEEELTGFALPADGKAWIQPYDKVSQWTPAYETYYQKEISIGTAAPGAEGWSFPALFQTSQAWVLLTEAAVDSFYFGSHLQPQADSGLYTIRMPEDEEAYNMFPQKATARLPWMMPWRVLIIGRELAVVVESNLVAGLNPPSVIADPSWIKPGRASWSWWSDPASPRNFNSLKSFIDLAAEMGWEYSLVDANWDLMEGGNIEQLVKYAHTKNVGILMWYNSGGAHNKVTERPRDIMVDPAKRKEEFKKLAGWGVKGVKVDFFQSDKQGIIRQYFDILKDAADNKILVNFHGCTLPRGWNRTWPNLVSMEAVRGAECYGFDSLFPSLAPAHNATIAFTRNVVGSMDYTPVTFTNQRFPHITTPGHELALSVLFESGIVHFADRVSAFRQLPALPKDLLKNLPVAWDESLLLAGYPGKYCVMARRKGETWYIAGINGTNEPQHWMLDLGRLKKEKMEGTMITDDADGKSFKTAPFGINATDPLHVGALAWGGFVVVLK